MVATPAKNPFIVLLLFLLPLLLLSDVICVYILKQNVSVAFFEDT